MRRAATEGPTDRYSVPAQWRPGGRPSERPRIATPTTSSGCDPLPSWRSLFGATEHHNNKGQVWDVVRDAVAVALRGTEDRNTPSGLGKGRYAAVAVALRATEDRNRVSPASKKQAGVVASPSGKTEDRNETRVVLSPSAISVAVALRSDRGSQLRLGRLQRDRRHRGGRPSGRPRIATVRWCAAGPVEDRWRSAFGAAEDCNISGQCHALAHALWRSPPRPTEDRNCGP